MAALPAPSGLRTSYFGDSGGATSRYYWVQAIYSWGRSLLSGPKLATTPTLLSSRNVVLVQWNPMPGAIGYNVYKTSTTSAPTSGSIAVAFNVSAPNFTDSGQSDSLMTGAVIVDGLAGMGVARAKYDFAVDAGAQGLVTPSTNTTIPSGSIVVGGTIFVKAAVTSLGSATVSVGTSAGSSASAMLAATAKASLTLAAVLNAVPVFATPVRMTADGLITFTIGAADLTAGAIEVFLLYYVPIN